MALRERLTEELLEQFAIEFRKLQNMTFEQYVESQMRLREQESVKMEKILKGWGHNK